MPLPRYSDALALDNLRDTVWMELIGTRPDMSEAREAGMKRKLMAILADAQANGSAELMRRFREIMDAGVRT